MMSTASQLSDSSHPTIINLVSRLTYGNKTRTEVVESLFLYVRDQIKFGFPRVWDEVKASETLYYGMGYCNTKATLMVALCRAASIPARLHFGLIDVRIMHGIMPRFVFPFMPKLGGHSWTEVQLDGEWKPIDSYINDKPFYERAFKRMEESGRKIGYSISLEGGQSSCEFNFGEQGFVHMGAVREDHGTWDDASDYFATDQYPRFAAWQKALLPMILFMSNRNITRLRQRPL
jgi:hypothetical protein